MSLLEEVLKQGFLKEEMQHAAVCVEARPATAVADASATPPNSSLPMLTESFEAYNTRKAMSDATLAECFTDTKAVLYGTLSHSHMSLCLRAFKVGAKWVIGGEEELGCKICDSNGRLSLTAVADNANCLELIEIVNIGALFEVLSWKMDIEQPDAASIISHALNSAQEIAMQQTEQQALQVLNGMAIPWNANAAQAVAFSTVQAMAREHLGHVVDDLEFVDIYEYCSNLGMGRAPFLPDLLQYMSTFVDPKKRRLKFSAFAEANKLGLDCPRMKVALIKTCYRRKPQNGVCNNPSSFWAHAKDHEVCLQEGEQLLHYMHVTAAPQMQYLDPKSRNVMLANVDVAVTTAYEMLPKGEAKVQETVRNKIAASSVKHIATWMEATGNAMPQPDPEAAWVRDGLTAAYDKMHKDAAKTEDANANPQSEKRPVESVHVPTAAMFDEASGRMIKAPEGSTVLIDERDKKRAKTTTTPQPLLVDWIGAAQGKFSKPDYSPGPDAKATAAVAAVMQHLFLQQTDDKDENSAIRQHVHVYLDSGASTRVVSAREKQPGALKLLPIVMAASKIVAATNHPHALPVVVNMIIGNKVAAGENGGGDGNKLAESGKPAPKKTKTSAKKASATDESGGASAAVAAESEQSPDAVAQTKTTTVYMLPDSKLPRVEQGQHDGIRSLQWSGDEKVHPFWLVRKLTSEQLALENKARAEKDPNNHKPARFNCQILAKECTMLSLNGGASCTWQITLPMLSNHEEVDAMEELLIQTFPPQKKAAAKEQHWTKLIKKP